MSNFSVRQSNARLVYTQGGSHIAQMRCSRLSLTYGVNATESHARRTRAFYPYLRIQGGFALTLDFIGWREYDAGMAWFLQYAADMLNAKNPSPMMVRVDSRNFVRLGIPTTGIGFGDHVGAMVFSPTIMFLSVNDPRDAKTNLLKTSSASQSDLGNDKALDQVKAPTAEWFYPESKLNLPGSSQKFLYDAAAAAAADAAAGVQAVIDPGTSTNQDPTAPENNPIATSPNDPDPTRTGVR